MVAAFGLNESDSVKILVGRESQEKKEKEKRRNVREGCMGRRES